MFRSTIHETPEDSTLTSDMDHLFRHLQGHYGACWGTFEIEDLSDDYSNKASLFLYVNDDIDLQILHQFMFTEWELETPDLVIPVFSSSTNDQSFQNQKMVETFKNGVRSAANTSNLWFITNGLNADLPGLIGSTFRDETLARRAEGARSKRMNQKPRKRKQLALIGIVCDDDIQRIIDFQPTIGNSPMDVKMRISTCDAVSLNSNHTHFIIIRGRSSHENATNQFRDRFEEFLHQEISAQTMPLSRPTMDINTYVSDRKEYDSSNKDGFPMVCMFIRGTTETIDLLYRKIQQEIPVVILKGSGAAADIIAFAYEEISAKNDEEFQESYFKVELARRLTDEYPQLKHRDVQRNEIRDCILSIAKEANQGKRKLLTFVDVNSTKTSANDFRRFILSALLQSQGRIPADKASAQLKRNLLLILNWNLPDLALSEIFRKDKYTNYSIPPDLFTIAVLQRKCEPFVDLFLDQGFFLHRYLKSDNFVALFNQARDREFFTTASLEGILGLTGDEEKMPENFVDQHLNTIIKRITGISHFFSQYEMDCNAMGIYFADVDEKGTQGLRIRAEKQALRHLTIYAVLMNRYQLAILLWKRSSEPVRMALICSAMFKNLAPFCHLSYQRLLIEKQAKVFADYAVEVLDISFNEDTSRTMALLDEKTIPFSYENKEDWNDMTTIEYAYVSENRKFLAHAACQKWMIRKYYGDITPRNLSWGLFNCSDYFKIITSAFFIFPMWFWIVFSPPTTTTTELHKDKSYSHVDEIRTLWNAPITKFSMSFVAYLLYLCLLTLAAMWPSCGNPLLDCFVWIWTALLVCEDVHAAYNTYRSQNGPRFKRSVVEIIVQMIFLILYLMIRIIGLWQFGTCQIVTAKAILGIGLIYYYYRIIYIFLPMSSRFGPLLIGLRHMFIDDFLTYLQLFAIIMVASSVAITAVVYPHHPFDFDLFRKTFVFRGLMSLFTSETSDLRTQYQSCSINATYFTEGEYSCFRLAHGRSFKYDNLDAYNQYGISSTHCNQTSWIAWFLLIQYFFLVKRFLFSLLTAMFTLTGMRVRNQSQIYWNYYRYEIVVEYMNRPRLPPPFVIISYIEMLIFGIGRRCVIKLTQYADRPNNAQQRTSPSPTNNIEENVNGDFSPAVPLVDVVDPSVAPNNDETVSASHKDRSLVRRLLDCKPCRRVIDRDRNKKQSSRQHWEDDEADMYWKTKAKQCDTEKPESDKVQDKLNLIWNSVIDGQKDTSVLQKSLRQINHRIFALEKLMTESHAPIEKQQETTDRKLNHALSRESPYVYTSESRFPVTEKSIFWTVPYDHYDPTLITLPKEHICFEDDERSFVESNLLNSSDPTIEVSLYKWNQIVEVELTDGEKMIVDRESWITNPETKRPTTYSLDAELNIPLNPVGRTGVRGRGALIRWGPNKFIMGMITRWRRHHNQFVTIDGQRVLEVMVFKDTNTNNWKLPAGQILGFESPYSIFCRNFNKLAFQDDKFEHIILSEEQDMIEYFESLTRHGDNNERVSGFESHLIYQGYIDDVRNTDNAWVEAEIWNFHYDHDMPFPRLRNDGTVFWKDVTYNLYSFPIQTSILREITRIHRAYIE